MTRPKALLIAARGTNRDRDMALALTLAGADADIRTMNEIAADPSVLQHAQLVVLPGGFSYGDDLGAGRLWALELQARFGDALAAFVAAGKPLLGVCNGFQALVKAGILTVEALTVEALTVEALTVEALTVEVPADSTRAAAARPPQRVSLARNSKAQFECRWVMLEREASCRSPWLDDLEKGRIHCPVAHGEGRFIASDDDLAALQANGQVALRYVAGGVGVGVGVGGSSSASVDDDVNYPDNPNGSSRNIAGICNAAGNVLGLMPHPENHISPLQQPHRHAGVHGPSGLPLFVAGVRFASSC